ncbi:MAG: DNA-directed RNA polymerase subunit omega [Planctomycetota bacterium]
MKESKVEILTNKLGGRFDLVVLIQKRLREIGRLGLKSPWSHNYHSLLESVMTEIMENKLQSDPPKPKEKND